MKIALAQINPLVGDIAGNTGKIADFIDRAVEAEADLVVFPELSVVGYPPRDLLRKERFVADSERAVEALASHCKTVAALVGFVRRAPQATGRPLENTAALLAGGEIGHVHVKTLLPTYDVFDETRYFQPGSASGVFNLAQTPLGLSICEDLWDAEALGRELYGEDPIARLAAQGARVIINMAASPFEVGKAARREELFVRQAARAACAIVCVNQVGGNDDLIFDGGSCVIGPGGEVIGRAASFREDLLVVDLDARAGRCEPIDEPIARVSEALKLGLRDYVAKCGFSRVVLGLSGGIDSAVVATLAADALGGDNVVALAMPSRYSSDHSLTDAQQLAENLGIEYRVVGIESMHAAYESALKDMLASGREEIARKEIAAENIQARLRGNIVMAFSNAFGHLPLATGNKSELSVGYCTLYGDMSGGLAPIGDVLKTVVYDLGRQLNAETGDERIPRGIFTKPPSAELKPDQTDQDKLPPYDVLDAILRQYVEQDRTAEQIVATGLDAEIVARVVRMVDGAEYKRRQAAPTLKISPRAFGTGRRMPIAQGYRC
ncbi:hypothetical protein LCGC14_0276600 [marine sediment metagenome]|uniref:NAD(+) synthase (glutamine-hydrolyzing) n=1 Tax=marine sediment metagenome TaxID=412755 RepID=A0A0F9WI99_9ZZZZ|nr:NAD+ synthase [Phycisphaerae bacterium]HDZ42662.1 NAD+ synthase [Phycisphaerae bacterium]